MNLFIDTNILLAFYHYSSDDLEELRKLVGLIEQERVTLFVPDQVSVEFRRNREAQIASAIATLRKQKLNLEFPMICREYEEYERLRASQRQYQEDHQALLEQLLRDAQTEELKADQVIHALFAVAHRTATTDEIIGKAERRVSLGNPPGKKGSLGDAVNWETLLEVVAYGADLCFVSDDGDFASDLDRDRFDGFLVHEWTNAKLGDVHLYKKLSDFFKDHFPNIRLADEIEKDLLIADLANSGSFASTHSIVGKLLKYDDFSVAQRNDIVSSTLVNNQVHWILGDSDVNRLIHNVIDGHESDLDKENLRELESMIEQAEEAEEVPEWVVDDDDDLPF